MDEYCGPRWMVESGMGVEGVEEDTGLGHLWKKGMGVRWALRCGRAPCR
jgi:hypothetical protein